MPVRMEPTERVEDDAILGVFRHRGLRLLMSPDRTDSACRPAAVKVGHDFLIPRQHLIGLGDPEHGASRFIVNHLVGLSASFRRAVTPEPHSRLISTARIIQQRAALQKAWPGLHTDERVAHTSAQMRTGPLRSKRRIRAVSTRQSRIWQRYWSSTTMPSCERRLSEHPAFTDETCVTDDPIESDHRHSFGVPPTPCPASGHFPSPPPSPRARL
jgi:hypothetical protein